MADSAPTQDLSENRQTELRISMIFITVFAAIFVALRFYARGSKSVKYGWDDWMILFAVPWLCCLMALGLLMIHFGLGTHQEGLTIPQLVGFGKTLLAFECVYIFTAAIIKTSLLLMYVRAFDLRRIKIASIILESAVIAWAIAIIALCIFQCTPVPKAWNPSLPGTCINLRASFIGNAIPNIVTDVLILALPIHSLWMLDTSIGLKLQLSFVFMLGSFVVFTAIYRFTTLFGFDRADTTWTLSTSCAWVVIEVASGVISVCLPTLGPLIQCGTWRERSRAMRSNNATNGGSSGTKKSLPTQVYAMEDVERGDTVGIFERLDSKDGALEDDFGLNSKDTANFREEREMTDLERQMFGKPEDPSDTERESDGEIGHLGGLAPPPRSSMIH